MDNTLLRHSWLLNMNELFSKKAIDRRIKTALKQSLHTTRCVSIYNAICSLIRRTLDTFSAYVHWNHVYQFA